MFHGLGNKKIKIAIFGTGWWSKFQIPAWIEIGNIEIAALYNRTLSKAEMSKEKFKLNCRLYNDPEELLKNEEVDLVDIITETPAHSYLVKLAARYGKPVICQKPVAFDYETCLDMANTCNNAEVPLIINENYRWQSHIRQMKGIIDSGRIGKPFRACLQFSTGGPEALANQPFLKTLRHYVLFDLGVHAFDTSRYLFGEPDRIYCQTNRTLDYINGDDMASAILTYKDMLCTIQLTDMLTSRFVIEGLKGIMEFSTDMTLKVTTKSDIEIIKCDDWKRYEWVSKEDETILGSDVVDAIVQAQRNIIEEIRYGKKAETTASEYMKTMELTFAAIRSSLTGESIVCLKY